MTQTALAPAAPRKPMHGFVAPRPRFWARFNQFSRTAQSPVVGFRPVNGDPDTVLLTLDGKVVGTINKRPHDWYLVTAMTGERVTVQTAEVDGLLIPMVWDRLTLAESIAKHCAGDDFLSGL